MVGMRKNLRDAWKALYPFASNYLYLPQTGVRMHFLDEGPAKSTESKGTIVCVHGNPTWSFYYRDLINAFRDKYRVIVPDHVGMGLSDKPQVYNYSLARRIEDLEYLLEKLQLQGPFTMVVHDWGGAIGMGYAVRHPEKIRSVLYLNTAAYRSPFMPSTIRLARVPLLGELLVRGFNAFVWGALLTSTKYRLMPNITSGYLAPYNSWANRVAVLRFVQDIPMVSSHPSYATLKQIEQGLPKLAEIPKTFVWGALDHVFNDKFLQAWREIYPQAEFHRLPGAGHYVMEDAPQEVVKYLKELLEKSNNR